MPENKFEKQVQQQMEDLLFRPSDVVWQRVEAELRRKKRRRVVFIFFLLAGLSLLGYTSYLIVGKPNNPTISKHDGQNSTNSTSNKSNSISQPGSEENKQNIDPDQSATPGNKVSETDKAQSKTVTSTATSPVVKNSTDQANDKKIKDINPGIVRNPVEKVASPSRQSPAKSIATKKHDKNIPIAKNNHQNNTRSKIDQEPVAADVVTGEPVVKTNIDQSTVTDNKIPEFPVAFDVTDSTATSVSKAEDKKPVMVDSVAKSEELKAPAVVKKNKLPIRWGIEVSGGLTIRRNSALQPFSGNSLNSPYAGTTGNGIPPAPIVRPPSPVKSGPAYSIGAFAELTLNKRAKVSAGVRYTYQSDRIRIGQYRDTLFLLENLASQYVNVNAVYRGSQLETFTNHYHFLQVPFRFDWQLNRGKKVPINWNIGATVGYLFKADALMYDTALGGIYYKDKHGYNPVHINLATGFSLQFGKKGRLQWSVGPEFTFDLSKLYSKSYDPKRYLMYGGLGARFYWPKRK